MKISGDTKNITPDLEKFLEDIDFHVDGSTLSIKKAGFREGVMEAELCDGTIHPSLLESALFRHYVMVLYRRGRNEDRSLAGFAGLRASRIGQDVRKFYRTPAD